MILWWLLTAAGLLGAAASVVGYRRTERRHQDQPTAALRRNPGICLYLNEKAVMNLYWQGDYEALTREIEEKTTTNTQGHVEARLPGAGAKVGRDKAEERVSRYIKEEGPITVIGRILDDVEKADNLVHVNLFTGSLEPSGGLDRALWSTHGKRAARVRTTRLGELNPFMFVSVTGRFRITDKTEDTTTISAPHGDGGARVSAVCETPPAQGDELPDDEFAARCLGRVQKWDPATGRLVIKPVLAVFQ